MSFSKTTDQVRARTKTVTRRLGWWFLKPGDRVRAVEKAMGLQKGEQVKRLAVIEVVSVRAERLDAIDQEDVIHEGFDWMIPAAFVTMFCRAFGCVASTRVNRIEYRYVDCQACGQLAGEVGDHPPAGQVLGELDLCPDCGWHVCPVCLHDGECCERAGEAGVEGTGPAEAGRPGPGRGGLFG